MSLDIVETMIGDENANDLDDKKYEYVGIYMEEGRFEVVKTTKRAADGEPGTKKMHDKGGMERIP